MKRLFGASLTIALAAVFGTSALAAELPEVKLSASNKVPECATPGRLTAYLQSRNPSLDPRFESVATQYMRHGEALGIVHGAIAAREPHAAKAEGGDRRTRFSKRARLHCGRAQAIPSSR